MPTNALANLNVRLGFIFDQKSLAGVEKQLQRTGDRLAKTGQNISLFISAPLALLGGSAIKAAGEFEQLSLAMEATFKNAGRTVAEAKAEIEALRKAALAPGLDFQQAVSASIRLQSVGLSAENARGVIVELANAIASTGGTAENLSSVTVQMGQMISKGKVLSQDLRIIQENLPIISDLMLKAFGTSNAEKIQELGITGKEFVSKITVEMSKLNRVSGGISNALVNAVSAVKQALSGIGEEIARVFNITDLSDRFAAALHSIVDGFKGLSDGTKKAIVYVGAFLVALGPLNLALGGLYSVSATFVKGIGAINSAIGNTVQSVTGLNGALGRVKIALGVVGLVVGLAVAFYTLSDNFNAAEFAAKKFSDAQTEIISSTAKEIGLVNENFAALKDETKSRFEKGKVVDALLKQYPQYLKGIDLEKSSISELTTIQNELNGSILRGVAERKKAEAVNSVYEEQAKTLLRIQQIKDSGKITSSEATLIDTGDMISAGGRAEAVILKLQQRSADLGNQVAIVSSQFDNAFKTVGKVVDPAIKAEYDLRDAAEAAREQIQLGIKSTIEDGDATQKTTLSKKELAAAAKLHAKEIKDTAKAEQELIDKQELDLKMLGEIEQAWKDEAAAAKAGIEAIKKANPNFDQIGPRGQTPQAQPSGITDVQQGLFDSAPISLAAQNIAFLREKMDELKASASQVGQAFNIAADGISSIAGVIGSTLESTSGSWADFAKSALTAIADVIGALIKLAVTQAFAASLKASSFLGPLAIPIAAAAGALAASLLKGLINRSSFAKGTNDAPGGLSLVGEKGPELVNLPRHSQVFPAHRTSAMLGDMGGGGSVQLSGEFAVRGTDLVLVLDRVQQKQNRVR